MTAEAIGRLVADLRSKRVRAPDEWRAGPGRELFDLPFSPVVDATAIYRSLVENPKSIDLYEDHPCIAPPWDHAVVAYVNGHGNTIAMTWMSLPLTDQWQPDVADHDIDWARVRWNLVALIFIGGRSPAYVGPLPTSGPVWGWRFAIYEDGTPADLRWLQIIESDSEWDMATLVLLGSLNFLNCSNVELVDPVRPRPEARRVARTGVEVQTINVFPPGRRTRSEGAGGEGAPIRSVRGHFAHYGARYERGLLFGKHEGRFWIPQRAVGDQPDYDLHVGAS